MKRGSRSVGSRWSTNILRFRTKQRKYTDVREKRKKARERIGSSRVVPSLNRLSIPRERRLLGSLHWYLCLLRHLAVIGCIGLGGPLPWRTYRATNEFGALQP